MTDFCKSQTVNSTLSGRNMHLCTWAKQFRVICKILVTSLSTSHFLCAHNMQHTHLNSYCYNVGKSVF